MNDIEYIEDGHDLEAILNFLDENEVYKNDVKDHLHNFILAMYGDKLVGSISHMEIGKTIFLIRSLAVDRRYRGRGIATTLHDKKIALAKKRGFTRVYARTSRENKRARRFYERKNYHELTNKELYEEYPFCRGCLDDSNKMRPYCKDNSKHGECPVVTYRLEI